MKQNSQKTSRTNHGWSTERRIKMRAMMLGPGNPRFGVKESDAIRKKKSVAHTGKKRGPHSTATKQKIAAAKLGKKMSIESRRKMSKARRGSLAKNWRGGITSLRHLLHTCLETRIWRESVFQRDHYTCQGCGVIGGHLNADHIKPMAVILDEYQISSIEKAYECEELWQIANGQTLCTNCHKTKTKNDLLIIRAHRQKLVLC